MKLEEKGKIVPPPILSTFPQMVSAEIQKWENIVSASHWYLYNRTQVDGADFYVGEEELGHIHMDGSIHLATNEALKKALLKNNLAAKFPYGNHWVQFRILTEKDVPKALFLFQVNYERLMGISEEILVAKIENSKKLQEIHNL